MFTHFFRLSCSVLSRAFSLGAYRRTMSERLAFLLHCTDPDSQRQRHSQNQRQTYRNRVRDRFRSFIMGKCSVPSVKPGDLLTCGHLAAEPWAFSQRWMHVKPKMCPQRSADSLCSPVVVQASKQMLQESPSPSSQRGGGVRAMGGGCSSM